MPRFRARARLARWWAWVIATASASAASGPAIVAPGSSRWTMKWTCALSAPPVPTTAFLTSRGAYSPDLEPAPCGSKQDDAARLAELQGRLRIFVEEYLLDRRGRGPMLGDHRAERRRRAAAAARPAPRFGIGADLAVGDMAQPIALRRDHAPAGAAETGIEADDQHRVTLGRGPRSSPASPAPRRTFRNCPRRSGRRHRPRAYRRA